MADAASLAARADAAEARLTALETGAGGADAAALAARVTDLQAEVDRLQYRVRFLKAAIEESDTDVRTALSGDEAAVAALREKLAARGG